MGDEVGQLLCVRVGVPGLATGDHDGHGPVDDREEQAMEALDLVVVGTVDDGQPDDGEVEPSGAVGVAMTSHCRKAASKSARSSVRTCCAFL